MKFESNHILFAALVALKWPRNGMCACQMSFEIAFGLEFPSALLANMIEFIYKDECRTNVFYRIAIGQQKNITNSFTRMQ